MSTSESSMMTLRLPNDLKLWLARRAKINFSSQNEQILQCLRTKMNAECAERAERVERADVTR